MQIILDQVDLIIGSEALKIINVHFSVNMIQMDMEKDTE